MTIPTLLGITIIGFCIIQLAPGDPASLKIQMTQEGGLATDAVSKEIVEQTRKLYGLDKPLHVRYWIWLKQVVTLDFGLSYKDQRPVMETLWEKLGVSLQLTILSIFLAYIIAIPLGVFSSVQQYSFWDKVTTLILFILYSLPSFWVAALLIMYLGSGEHLDIFPIFGLNSDGAESWPFWEWLKDRLWHLVLPVTCLTYGSFAFLSRMQRAGMMEVIRQDYITTARAKGLSEKKVVFKHAMRNSLIPIVTLMASLLPALLGGSVIIEQIFSIPGMGKWAFDAVLSRDYPVVMAIFTISSFLTLLGILLSDILYALVDPRISFEALENR